MYLSFSVINVVRDPELNIISCDGIEIVGMECSKVAFRDQKTEDILLENYTFVKYGESFSDKTSLTSALRIMCEIVLQNCPGVVRKLSVCEIKGTVNGNGLIGEVQKILNDRPLVDSTFLESKCEELKDEYDVILISGGDLPRKNGRKITDVLTEQGFVIYQGSEIEFEDMDLDIIIKCEVETSTIFLLRPFHKFSDTAAVINTNNQEFSWVKELKTSIENKNCTSIYLVSQNDEMSGILGLVECLNRERSAGKLRAMSLRNDQCFSLDSEFCRKQLRKNVVSNIFKNDCWGTYIHVPFNEIQNIETEKASVSMSTARDFSTLKWVETSSDIQR